MTPRSIFGKGIIQQRQSGKLQLQIGHRRRDKEPGGISRNPRGNHHVGRSETTPPAGNAILDGAAGVRRAFLGATSGYTLTRQKKARGLGAYPLSVLRLFVLKDVWRRRGLIQTPHAALTLPGKLSRWAFGWSKLYTCVPFAVTPPPQR